MSLNLKIEDDFKIVLTLSESLDLKHPKRLATVSPEKTTDCWRDMTVELIHKTSRKSQRSFGPIASLIRQNDSKNTNLKSSGSKAESTRSFETMVRKQCLNSRGDKTKSAQY